VDDVRDAAQRPGMPKSPTPVVLSHGESVHVVPRLLTERSAVGDLPGKRDQHLEPEVDSRFAGSNRKWRAHSPACS
jgi:hypothetical protein